MRKLILAVLMIGLCLTTDAKTPWTNKPPIGSQIDWGHPLSKGLVGCWLMNEGSGVKIYDLCKNATGIFDTGAITWKPSLKGIGVNFGNSSTANINLGNNPIFSVPNFTFSIYAIALKKTTGSQSLFCKTTNTGSGGFYLRVGGWSGYGKIGGGVVEVLATDFTVNTWNHVALVLSSTNLIYYLNGKQSVSTAKAGIGINGIANSTFIGRLGDYTGGQFWDGDISVVYFYSRALSPSEIQQLYQDPYCFIKPPSNWSMFKTAVASAFQGWVNIITD